MSVAAHATRVAQAMRFDVLLRLVLRTESLIRDRATHGSYGPVVKAISTDSNCFVKYLESHLMTHPNTPACSTVPPMMGRARLASCLVPRMRHVQ